jgi:hypothetical protein
LPKAFLAEGRFYMALQFLRGNSQAPKGHAFLIARSASDPRVIFCTYCIVPPIPMSLAKYIPPLLAAQIPAEELQDATNLSGMPIPPMLEEVSSMEYVERLAERRDDDLCDIGPLSSRDEMMRVSMAATSSQEYGQLYASYTARYASEPAPAIEKPAPLDDLDADELLLHSMSDRQRLAELGKLIGTARYAVEGRDDALLTETRRKMQRIVRLLADKYRGNELVTAATANNERGAKLAELYLSRAYKLLDEEYAAIPAIERAIRELQES